jgi:hypothetical protein
MTTPSKRSAAAIAWGLVLVAGGCAGAVASMLTSAGTRYGEPDPFDSPYLVITFLALVPLTGAAGWFIPEAGRWWGIVAAGPHYVAFAVFVVWALFEGLNPSLAPVGFMFLVVLSLPPWGAGLAAAWLRRRWQRRGGLVTR